MLGAQEKNGAGIQPAPDRHDCKGVMMAVTKRTRFEVLRRDSHTCRYCGQSAPDVKLTVDHVVPVALGGSDDPSNLASACWECNIGKASTSPSEAKVAEVSEATLKFIRLARSAWAIREAEIDKKNAFIAEVGAAIRFEKPDEWRTSIARFYVLDVPMSVLMDAVRIAADKYDPFGKSDRFKYFCGVVWNQVRETNAAIEARVDLDGCFVTDQDIDDFMADGAEIERHHSRSVDKLLQNVIDGTYSDAREEHDAMPSLEVQLCG
jgi:hypothetical protein